VLLSFNVDAIRDADVDGKAVLRLVVAERFFDEGRYSGPLASGPCPLYATSMATYKFQLNGKSVTAESWDPDQPLLYVLRNSLGQHGPKFGCGLSQCGACTVLVDGKATRSCVTPVKQAAGRAVTTLEGLGAPEKPDAVQAAFIAEQAAQCGYCTNGMIMAAKSLLSQTPKPTLEQVKQGLAGNLCRCGTHTRIVRAVMRAAQTA
jgi:nicotinate dehydrogenase subunit A